MPKKYFLLSITLHLLLVVAFYHSTPLEMIKKTTASIQQPIQFVENFGSRDLKKNPAAGSRETDLAMLVEAYLHPESQEL